MSENRVDPTVAGLYLVGFITLFFGLLGILTFLGNDTTDAAAAAMGLLLPVGFVLIIFAYMAGKAGNAFATALFAFIGVAFLGIAAGATGSPLGAYAAAIFFIIFAIVAFIIGAPKLLAILLILVALFFLFFGFAVADGTLLFTTDASQIYAGAFGLFSFLAFIIATYLAVALGTQKMPVF